jgi:hypothetical protein
LFSGQHIIDMPTYDDYCNLPMTPLPADEGEQGIMISNG